MRTLFLLLAVLAMLVAPVSAQNGSCSGCMWSPDTPDDTSSAYDLSVVAAPGQDQLNGDCGYLFDQGVETCPTDDGCWGNLIVSGTVAGGISGTDLDIKIETPGSPTGWDVDTHTQTTMPFSFTSNGLPFVADCGEDRELKGMHDRYLEGLPYYSLVFSFDIDCGVCEVD